MLNWHARVWALLLVACLALALCGCEQTQKEEPPLLSEQSAASIAILMDQLGLDEISAMDILSQLHRAGYTENIRMAFVRKDEQGNAYYHLWLESAALDIVTDENGWVTDIRNGEIVYKVTVPQQPDAPKTENTGDKAVENPVENTDNLVENEEKPVETPEKSPSESDPPKEPTLRLISLTSPIKAGQKATLQAAGVAGETYAISVRYASGESTAQGLEPQTADADGLLSWTFRVASRVAPGEYSVTVTGAGETLALTLTVTAP